MYAVQCRRRSGSAAARTAIRNVLHLFAEIALALADMLCSLSKPHSSLLDAALASVTIAAEEAFPPRLATPKVLLKHALVQRKLKSLGSGR